MHGVIRTQKNISDHCSWLRVLVEGEDGTATSAATVYARPQLRVVGRRGPVGGALSETVEDWL